MLQKRILYPHPEQDGVWCVPLTRGYVALIDACDVDRAARHTWCAAVRANTVYANGKVNGKMAFLQRFIVGAASRTETVLLFDGNGLNCRRSNIAVSEQRYPPPAHRLLSRIEKPDGDDGCWLYQGSRDQNGYGSLWVEGRLRKAHRVAWEIANGPVSEGLFVCHHCDNPSCVNPAHLFIGTNGDNMRDMMSKGRGKGQYVPRETPPGRYKKREAIQRMTEPAPGGRVQHGAVADGESWSALGRKHF